MIAACAETTRMTLRAEYRNLETASRRRTSSTPGRWKPEKAPSHSAAFDRFTRASAVDDHGHARGPDDALGHAPHHQPGDAAAPVRGHEDRVAAVAARGAHDTVGGRGGLRRHSTEAHARGLGELRHRGDLPLAVLARAAVPERERARVGDVALGVHRRRHALDRVVARDAGAELARELQAGLDRL